MLALRVVGRHYKKLISVPARALRILFKRGNMKSAIVTLVILTSLLAIYHKQSYSKLAKKEIIRKHGNEKGRIVSPVRNIQEYVMPKEIKMEKRLKKIRNCPLYPKALVGNMTVNQNITPSFEEVEKASGADLLEGGCYSPVGCIPRQKVAVIIPFKDREAHLKTLMFYLHPMLQRQMLHYCIYVAEQFDNGTFNKAMVMNAAFEEVMKVENYDCIIFHDVDMIPESDKNLYTCALQPTHLSPAIDKFQYKRFYGTEFGGVTAITPEQYRLANGHSNQFWGWGGEDNDMEFRIHNSGMYIFTTPVEVGRYKMIVHKHPWKFTNGNSAWKLNETRKERAKVDGLSDLTYQMLGMKSFSTYTKLMIDIRKLDVKAVNLFIDGKPAMSIDIKPGECRWHEYPGKYMDFSLDLAKYPEAAHLKALKMNQRAAPPKLPKIPDGIEVIIPTTPAPLPSFSLVDSKEEAIRLCDLLSPECQGIQREGSSSRFSLRRANVPRSFVIKTPAKPKILRKEGQPVEMQYHFPDKTAFVKYCPGEPGGSIQGFMNPLGIDLTLNVTEVQHTYSFEVYFTILQKPSKFIFYSDKKQFESRMDKAERFQPFRWSNSKSPDPNVTEVPLQYKLITKEHPIPNVPGCYAVRSQILDDKQHPYYQWNWWFEVSSGDRKEDAIAREEYWRKQIDLVTSAKKLTNEQMEEKNIMEKQLIKDYLHKKEMAGIQRKEFKVNLALERKLQKPSIVLDKEIDVQAQSIEVFDAKHGYPTVKYEPPPTTTTQFVVREKAFHAGLPEHLRRQQVMEHVP